MVFDDFYTKDELLTLLPLKTTRENDIYKAVKSFCMEKNVPLKKLVSVTMDNTPSIFSVHLKRKKSAALPPYSHC